MVYLSICLCHLWFLLSASYSFHSNSITLTLWWENSSARLGNLLNFKEVIRAKSEQSVLGHLTIIACCVYKLQNWTVVKWDDRKALCAYKAVRHQEGSVKKKKKKKRWVCQWKYQKSSHCLKRYFNIAFFPHLCFKSDSFSVN